MAALTARVLDADRPLPGNIAGEQWLEWINSAMPLEEIDVMHANPSTSRLSACNAFLADLEPAWTVC